MTFQFADLHLTLAHSIFQGQVLSISTASTSKTANDRADNTIAIKYEVSYRLSISI